MYSISPKAFVLPLACLLVGTAMPMSVFAKPSVSELFENEQEKGRNSGRVLDIIVDTLNIFRREATAAAATGMVGLGVEYVGQRINSDSGSPNSSYSYIGSYFVEPNYGIHVLGTPTGQWYMFNHTTQRWDSSNPPNFNAYRMVDFYRDSSGRISSVSFF